MQQYLGNYPHTAIHIGCTQIRYEWIRLLNADGAAPKIICQYQNINLHIPSISSASTHNGTKYTQAKVDKVMKSLPLFLLIQLKY